MILPESCASNADQAASRVKARALGHVIGVGVLIASWAFLPGEWNAVENFDPPKRAILLTGIAVTLAAALSGTHASRRSSGMLPVAATLTLWMGLRTVLREQPWAEITVLLAWFAPVASFAAGYVVGPVGWKAARGWIAAAAAVQATLMLLQWWQIDPVLGPTTAGLTPASARMIGTVGYHNQAAGFLAVATGMTIWTIASWQLRMALVLAATTVIGLTGCRGAAAAWLLANGAAWFVECRGAFPRVYGDAGQRRAIGALLTLLLPFVLLSIVPPVRERASDLVRSGFKSPDASSRLLMWSVAAHMIAERPLTGHGAGSYALQYIDRLGDLTPSPKRASALPSVVFAREAHEDYLQGMAEFGLVGTGLSLLLLVIILMRVLAERTLPASGWPAAVVFAVVYIGVEALLAFPLQTSLVGPLAGLCAGATLPEAAERSTVRAGRHPVASHARTTGLVALLAGAALCAAGIAWVETGWCVVAGTATGVADIVGVAAHVPPWGHRYRALLGGRLAAQGASAQALCLLVDAEKGYRDVPLLNNLGLVLGRVGRWSEAAAIWERWCRSGLDHRVALSCLADAMEQLRRPGAAADLILEKQRLWPPLGIRDRVRATALLIMDGRARKAVRLNRAHAESRTTPVFLGGGGEEGTPPATRLTISAAPLGAVIHARSCTIPAGERVVVLGATLLMNDGQCRPVDIGALVNTSVWSPELRPNERGVPIPASLWPPDGRVEILFEDHIVPFDLIPPSARHHGFTPDGRALLLPDVAAAALLIAGANTDGHDAMGTACEIVHEKGSLLMPLRFGHTNPRREINARPSMEQDLHLQLLNLLGAAWMADGNPLAARWQFERVLAADPSNAVARLNIEQIRRFAPH